MNRFSFTLLIGLLLMLFGVNGVSNMSTRALVTGYDGSVINNVYSPNRLALIGVVGSNIANELIIRGQGTVIVEDSLPRGKGPQDESLPLKARP